MKNILQKLLKKISKKKEKIMDNVAVIGLGYVGFPLACAIATSKKYNIYGLDVDEQKINKINKKISPLQDAQTNEDLKKIKIHASNDFSILKEMKYIVICVPTPVDHQKKPDLTSVKKAAEGIAVHLTKGQIIILESTVNPGVCEEVILPILQKTGLKGGEDFELVHCPERINPGDEKWNVYNIPRNISGLTKEGTKKAADFYRSFIHAEINEVSSLKVAESTKIVENIFRDVNIAYVNELAKSFDTLGIDVVEVIKGASNKPFGFMAHYPGCGIGGHCIPVDPYYLIEYAKRNGFNHDLLKIARKVNNSMPKYTVDKLLTHLKNLNIPLKNAKIGVLGISYKANIGDIRESPALEIIDMLKKLDIDVFAHDPHCPEESTAELKEILNECIAVVIATNHKEFLSINNWKNIELIVDGRNCLDKNKIEKQGIVYDGIGRGVKEIARKVRPQSISQNIIVTRIKPLLWNNPLIKLVKD